MSQPSSYAVAVPGLLSRLRAGDAVPAPLARIDSRLRASASFIEGIRRFAELAYAPLGVRTPRWVLYDCAVIPGLVFGLAGAALDLAAETVESLGFAADYEGPVPLSILAALPTLEPDHWFVYEVASLDQAGRGDLRAATLGAAIELLGAETITATAPWRSSELAIHAAHAPLELLAAELPAHQQPATAVVRYRPGAAAAIAATAELDASDDRALATLQAEIEAGSRPLITGPADAGTWPIAYADDGR